MKKKVAIVVLNYNGGDLLVDCIKSFLNLEGIIFKLILVDNGSNDGSIEKAEKIDAGKKIKIIHTGQNLGYTGGNNVGIEYAMKKGFDYVMIVNSDTIVLNPLFLKEMVDYGERTPDAAIIGPKVFFRSRKVVQNTICNFPFFLPTLISWLAQKVKTNKKIRSGDKIQEVEVLNGVCILLKSTFLKSVGLFDFDIFMYREDTDLALRAKKDGWKSIYYPVDSILHMQKYTGYDYTSMVNFLLKRNAVYVLYKHGFYFDAYCQFISGISLSFLRYLKFQISKKDSQKFRKFFILLLKANISVLKNKIETKEFGPPHYSWNEMIN